ncbi:MAG: biopolymer transporter ExbD [Planctomycetota bacterium]|jgi:biopolymer transport protein ExbD
MPIKFRCPKCTQAYSVPSKNAGARTKCKKCGAKLRIPELKPQEEDVEDQASAPESAQKPELSPELKNAFNNLFDDDDFEDAGEGNGEEITFKEAPAADSTEAATSESQATADDDDNIDAVLAFEKELEDAGHEPASPAPVYVPDELFAGDDDEDEEDDFFGSGSRVDDEEMDLTPMVDVTFLLLIFFMITASFSIQKTLEVPAPDPDEEGASTSISIQEMEETSVTVHIDSRNVMYVDDEPVADPTRLPDMLRASRMNEVLITSHENALHEMVVKAIDAANEVQMQKIRLGVTRGAE